MDDTALTWQQFEVCNPNTTSAFEDMCRKLFAIQFFNSNSSVLHSNPNNPGVEVEPIYDKHQKKWISFQCKYFSSSVDYTQINHSAEKTVEKYGDQLDVFYLYCNRDVTKTSDGYTAVESLLAAKHIQIVPICNRSILDQIMDYPIVANYYFHKHLLSPEWFAEKANYALDALGPRLNREFNVETQAEKYLNLFLSNEKAVQYINEKKKDAIEFLSQYQFVYSKKYRDFFKEALFAIRNIPDIDSSNLHNCAAWEGIASEACAHSLEIAKQRLDEINEILNPYLFSEKKAEKSDVQLINELREEERILEQFVSFFKNYLSLDFEENRLLTDKVIVFVGNAGAGKSQLFGNAVSQLLSTGNYPILLLGGFYQSNDFICSQIPKQLGLSCDIDTFFSILEGFGDRYGKNIYLFIDALNESVYREIWKDGFMQLNSKINKYPHLFLAVSVRAGFECVVFGDSTIAEFKSNKILKLIHDGFHDNTIQAIEEFLNYYGIPFSPDLFLQYELSNPLFLKLFCVNYKNEEFDLLQLFKELVERCDNESQKLIGEDGTSSILTDFVDECARYFLRNNTHLLPKKELLRFEFWKDYGIQKKPQYLNSLERFGLLISYIRDGKETFYFNYNLMEEFLCARVLVQDYKSSECMINCIIDNILSIKNREIHSPQNIQLAVVCFALYAEKHHVELINDVLCLINDSYEKNRIIHEYVDSYKWRGQKNVDREFFLQFITQHHVQVKYVWDIFINNSIKSRHPLNAECLHQVLYRYTLAYRDYLWTTYINQCEADDERLFQLILLFEQGNSMKNLTEENIKLLLILFSWILTASNRYLRDKTSKAMIVLLNQNISLCVWLLCKFQSVNDPYIIQRLYGVVFGAIMFQGDRDDIDYSELGQYVYQTVFDQPKVVPDIILRDYAQLIVDRCCYKESELAKRIDISKTTPPFCSDRIPIVEKQEYYDSEKVGCGFNSIAMSMEPDCLGGPSMYGDFGRYKFQSALHDFVGVDVAQMYHYAMQYIRDELGYKGSYFDHYDCSGIHNNISRNDTKKTERIGKKYQWIAMHHILATVSDHYYITGDSETPDHPYRGLWELYLRDFDPTINRYLMIPSDFQILDSTDLKYDFLTYRKKWSTRTIKKWVNSIGLFFETASDKLSFVDQEAHEWIYLHRLIMQDQNPKGEKSDIFTKGNQRLYFAADAYFIKSSELEKLKAEAHQIDFHNNRFCLPHFIDYNQSYSKECTWRSRAVMNVGEYWYNFDVRTDKYEIIKHDDYNEGIDSVLMAYGISLSEEKVYETIHLGKFRPSYAYYSYEGQYDASQEDTLSYKMPCIELIEAGMLTSRGYDGFFYNQKGDVIAFDAEKMTKNTGLVIRKDYLCDFLRNKGYSLVWFCGGERQYFHGDRKQDYCHFDGVFYMEDGEITGSMK